MNVYFRGIIAVCLFLTGLMLAGCSDSDDGSASSRSLVSIAVTPTNPSIARGTAQQLVATGTYSDNSTQDLTNSVSWSSADTATASIDSAGKVTALAAGTCVITATSGGKSGTTTLTVTSATLQSIAVTPVNPSIARGTAQQLVATGTYSDNSTQDLTNSVSWSSADTATASVNNAGKVTALAAGTCIITATSGGKSGTTNLTVTSATLQSIAVTPVNPSIAKGTAQQLTATGTYSDNSTQDLTNSVSWSSADTATASVNNAGKATALAAGTSVITATSGGKSGTTTLTVTSATLQSIAVTPVNPSIAKGTAQQFTATGTYSDNSTQDLTATVTWGSSNTSVATVSNAAGTNGRATALAAGSATITATLGALSNATTLTVTAATLSSITVTPANPSIAKGTARQFTATGTYSDNSTQDLTATVTWGSSDTSVATVSNAAGTNGRATALAAGSATITATLGALSNATTLTVTAATLSSIAVTPANPGISVNPTGTSLQFTAIGTYSDNSTQNLTTQVTWSSSATAVAAISNAAGSNGKATTVAAGSTTIMATLGSASGTTTLTVTNATLVSIAVTPATPQILVGGGILFTATGTYSDASTQNLTTLVNWTSSKTSVATVSNSVGSQGLATALAAGSATITATSGSIHGSVVLEVEIP